MASPRARRSGPGTPLCPTRGRARRGRRPPPPSRSSCREVPAGGWRRSACGRPRPASSSPARLVWLRVIRPRPSTSTSFVCEPGQTNTRPSRRRRRDPSRSEPGTVHPASRTPPRASRRPTSSRRAFGAGVFRRRARKRSATSAISGIARTTTPVGQLVAGPPARCTWGTVTSPTSEVSIPAATMRSGRRAGPALRAGDGRGDLGDRPGNGRTKSLAQVVALHGCRPDAPAFRSASSATPRRERQPRAARSPRSAPHAPAWPACSWSRRRGRSPSRHGQAPICSTWTHPCFSLFSCLRLRGESDVEQM